MKFDEGIKVCECASEQSEWEPRENCSYKLLITPISFVFFFPSLLVNFLTVRSQWLMWRCRTLQNSLWTKADAPAKPRSPSDCHVSLTLYLSLPLPLSCVAACLHPRTWRTLLRTLALCFLLTQSWPLTYQARHGRAKHPIFFFFPLKASAHFFTSLFINYFIYTLNGLLLVEACILSAFKDLGSV